MVHLIFGAAIRGRIVRGPMVGRQHAFALVRDWLAGPRHARDVALAELARRYLAGHGPATESDLARWAGLPLRDARAGLGAIARELRRLPSGLLDLAGAGAPPGCRRRACSAPSSRSCWAGARARRSSATTSPGSSPAACSAASPSSGAGPWPCGACRATGSIELAAVRRPGRRGRGGAGARRRGAAAVPGPGPVRVCPKHGPTHKPNVMAAVYGYVAIRRNR